jgi:STE24 endopeptidase
MLLKKGGNETAPQAKRYQAMKNRLFLFHLALQAGFCAALLFFGWSRGLKVAMMAIRDDFFFLNALYFAAFGFLGFLVFFPLDFYEGFVWERRFGLSRQSFRSWLWDVSKKSVLSFVIGLIGIEALYFFFWQYPDRWWLWAAGFWFFLSVALARIFPQVILPLFYKVRPLEAGPLRERLMDFMRSSGIDLKDILVLDFSKKTVKANAMVAGLGRTKRIYVSDTLVASFSLDEIEMVLAHEVAHYRYRDTWNLVGVGLAAALLSFGAAHLILRLAIPRMGFAALSDIAGLPLVFLVLSAMGLILLPLQNGYSRFLEARADRWALRKTKRPDTFVAMMRRLAEKNLSDFSPPRWVELFCYDHPPIGKRILMAQQDDPDHFSS